MKASPFWRKVMRVTGILCVVSIFISPVIYLKYLMFDLPTQASLAHFVPANYATVPLNFRYIDMFRNRAKEAAAPSDRIQAINWLRAAVLMPNAMLTHSIECHSAEDTIDQLADYDKDSTVRLAAQNAIVAIGSKGAIIERK